MSRANFGNQAKAMCGLMTNTELGFCHLTYEMSLVAIMKGVKYVCVNFR